MPQWLIDISHTALPWLAQRLPALPGEFWSVLAEMSPYLLFGFLVAGLLSVLIRPESVERHLGGKGIWSVLKASAFGVPLPLCSCGVIPVAASLRRHGASRGSTIAFLISTPMTGADSIFATFSLLGLTFAIFRPISALVSGMLGGMAVDLADRKSPQTDTGWREPPPAKDGQPKWKRIVSYGFGTLPQDIGRSMLVGLLIAALMSALIPRDYFAGMLGTGIGAMLVMMLLGIPVYVCATASVPVAAALVMAGISPGAALVFLMTGPATNAATIATIWKVLGRRSAIIYLLSIAVTALASGLTLDYILRFQGQMNDMHMHTMIPSLVNNLCGLVLLAVLARGVYKSFVGHWTTTLAPSKGNAMPATTLRIEGMTCSHCASVVEKALTGCKGVISARVSLANKQADISGDGFADDELRRAVESLGYKILTSSSER